MKNRVTHPKYLTDLAASTFANCKKLQEVIVPSKVKILVRSFLMDVKLLRVSKPLSKVSKSIVRVLDLVTFPST